MTRPCRVVAQMTNFESHVRDAGMDPTSIPLTFFRKASGSVTGPFGDIVKPEHVKLLDYELEIGLVIGRELPVGTQVTEENWTSFVAGLVVTNDVSARDWQREKSLGGGQFARGKSFDGFCPLGPWIVTKDEIPNPNTLSIKTTLNGQTMQDHTTGDMIFDVPALIESLSSTMTLRPGSVILTGTPQGVGFARTPPVWMKDGDTIVVEIGRIGRLENPVRNE